jgi:hypothetical protein
VGIPHFYDAYTFVNGESNACINVAITSACGLFSAAYSNSYNPTNLCQNYLADSGSGINTNYSFNVAAGATFVVVVNQVNPGDECPYRLDVTGDSCRPFLNIAQIAPTQVALDWTTAAIGYRLENTNTLANPPHPSWIPVGGTPVINNSRFHITNSITPGNRFYQLHQP